MLPTDDLRRPNKMAGFSQEALLVFSSRQRNSTNMHPHQPHTAKHLMSNAFTNADIHLCQNPTPKRCHGYLFLSPGGPWGPGCPMGPGDPWGPNPGAPGGPCKPCSPGRPGSPAGRRRHRSSFFPCCVRSCLLKMLDKVLWESLANKTLFQPLKPLAWAQRKGCQHLLSLVGRRKRGEGKRATPWDISRISQRWICFSLHLWGRDFKKKEIEIQSCIFLATLPLNPCCPGMPGKPCSPRKPGSPGLPFSPGMPAGPGEPGNPFGPGRPTPGSP